MMSSQGIVEYALRRCARQKLVAERESIGVSPKALEADDEIHRAATLLDVKSMPRVETVGEVAFVLACAARERLRERSPLLCVGNLGLSEDMITVKKRRCLDALVV